jgi:hypothetical protein
MNRLQALAGRPISEGERRGAFRAGAAALIVAATLLLLIPDGGPPSISSLPAAPAAQYRPLESPPRPAPVSGPVEAARRFLAGFLPFLYGQGSPAAIRSVASGLADRLASSRHRVPPAALNRRPRAVQLEGGRLGAGRASVAARIEDGGVASYPILLTLARRGGRWLVVAEGMD